MYEEIRQAVEDRRAEWLEDNLYPFYAPSKRAVLDARCQELAWVIRLLDALD